MSDFIREVDEEYRRDQAAKFWQKYQNIIIGIAVLVVAATGGWRLWESQRLKAAQATGAQFQAAQQLARDGKGKEAEEAFLEIAKSGSSGYQVLARLRGADEISGRDAKEAVQVYDAIAADGAVDPLLQQVARLRAAFLRIDDADQAEIKQRIEPLAAPTSPFRHTARELLGLAALKAGDMQSAGRWLDMVVADPQAPQSTRERATTLLGLVASGATTGQ